MKRRGWLWVLGGCLAAIVVLGAVLVLFGPSLYRAFYLSKVGDSGGVLRPAQAAYDVRRYDLDIYIAPATRTITGHNLITVAVNAPLDVFEVQLDDLLQISAASVDGVAAQFTHADGLISVRLPVAWQAGERHAVRITYGGQPVEALNPPWIDGFVWEQTPSGAPWIGVTTEGSGGDLWWPCKDHPSDEPDEGMTITVTVPDDLVALSNGRKTGEQHNADGTLTTHWTVHYPINNYNVTLNIAPYVPVEAPYHGIDGTLNETIIFWAIPEHAEPAKKLWAEQGAKILTVLGKRFGEYPFLKDKYWVAETPYLGMEHQTIIAYGNNFKNNAYGFDNLLLHETAHEWWGNKITARDWADFWIHEGFGSYAEAVYVNDTLGKEKYFEYMRRTCSHVGNRTPIVQGENITASRAYIGDIYTKGSCVLHALRWLVGDEAFFQALYRFQTDPQYAYGLVDTQDFIDLVAQISGQDIDWFWQRYIYQAAAPRLYMERSNGVVTLRWDDPGFAMPLPVKFGGILHRINFDDGTARISVPAGAELEIDPQGWVLMERE